MEVVIAIAAKIVEYTIGPVGQWLCYSCHYKSNMETLKNLETMLRDAKNRVQHAVKAASNNGDKIEDDVERWLTKVDDIIHQLAIKKFGGGEEEAESSNSTTSYLKLKQRHQISQEAKKMVGNIAELLKNGNFNRVSYRPALEATVTTRYMDYVALESRMSVAKGIMEALGDANINKIGVWGMAGVGKSTMMREIVSKVKEDKLFHEVVMAIVSESPDVRRIQGEIADTLSLKLDQETEIGRASQLQWRLSKDEEKDKEKKILIILDDIWKQLDLVEIGITPSKRCKIVLTSRNRDVLTCGMGTQKDFALQTLLKEEAWDLFKKMAGHEFVKDPNVRDIATKVAEKCAGLPIALVTVSKALKNKSLGEWKDALRQLGRLAPKHVTEMLKIVYAPIELSYKKLESQELKSLILLCAQLPTIFHYLDLLKYCYGYGLFHEGINTLEEARNMLDTQLRKLRDSCLLLESSNQFRMHDVVRDVVTIIASNNHNMFVMRDDGGLKALSDADSLKRCETLSILGGDINQLPNKMECPQLRFFHVYSKDRSLQIPDTLFQWMDKLNVLGLTKMQLSPIPSSLLDLRNLQTLCLDNCVLGDIAGIGGLENLVILSLVRSDISKLPREIESLVHLRLLDLSNCSKLEVIPPNVLSRLVELEELYMKNSFVQWEVTERSNNANLAELNHMLRLSTLEIHIRDACMLPRDLQFEKLERYDILVGNVWDWSDKHECSRRLKLKLKTSFQSEVGIKMLLNRTECLYLDELKGVKSVLHELDREGFQQLKHLHIQNNDEIKYIIITSPMHISTISFPALEIFHLKNMTGLEDICHGQLHSKSFRNLRVVNVENCEKLKFVFPSSVARGLSQLQELQIRECSNMGAIVVKEGGEIEDTDMIFFPQLRRLALEHLPELMSFLGTKNSLGTEAGEIVPEGTLDFDMPILHEQVVFPNLKRLELSSLDLEETQHNQHRARLSCRLTTMEAMSRFQNLSNLEVQGSCNIKYLLSFSTARFMVHLKHLHISECKAMEEVLVTEEIAAAGEITKEVFPRLECLKLTDLPSLTRFCVGCNIQFPSLENMCIDHCPNLVTFVFNRASLGATTNQKIIQTNAEERPPTVMQPLFNVEVAFPCLKRLTIRRMDYLKFIWQNRFAENSFCNLQLIDVELCENLVSIFQSDMLTRFQSVEKLFVADCSSLQQVFELQELNVNENQAVTAIPLKGLRLARLPQMKHVWSKDPKAIFNFKNLKEIHASGCENLRSFFPASVARSLMQLEHLKIIDCGVEEIVEGEGREDAIERFEFPQVTFLTLESLPRLKWFYPGVHTLECPMLKEMWVAECQKVGIFASGLLSFQETLRESRHEISTQQPLFLVHEVAFPSLEKLGISHMDNLITIWHDQVAAESFCNIQELEVTSCENVLHVFDSDICSFQNLRQIYAEGCLSLKSFFPTVSMATSLTQLEDLLIVNCGIEEIVARGGEEATPRFLFPRMTTLNLEGLAELKWFYRGVHTSKWPSLKNMQVDGCQKVEIFASEYMSFQEALEESRQSKISSDQPLFLVDQDQVAFPSLEKLIISHMDDMKVIWNTQIAADSFCKLQMMRVEFCANLNSIFPFKMFKVFQSLEWVNVVGCGSLKQVFDLQGPSFQETSGVIVTQLKDLYLRDLPKLKHISNKDPRDILSFQNLCNVRANGCESMECLFPASMARTLTELETLKVIDCGVEAIVEKEEAEGRLVFPKLTSLELGILPKLKWISPGAHNLEWPVLKKLKAWGCDQVSIFASKFSRFQETSQQCLLESSIQHPLFLVEEGTFPKLEALKSDLHHSTWCDQFFIEPFYKLKVLEVKCNDDTSVVSLSNLLKRLQNLEKLVVSCTSWQEIIRYEDFIGPEKHVRILPRLKELRVSEAPMLTHLWKEDVQESLVFDKVLEILAVSECHRLKSLVPSSACFHNLTDLEILSCNGLINLITYTTAKSMVQLRKMRVSSCEGMTEIVARGDDQAKVVIAFSKLTCLKFDCLPNFTSFCSGSYSIMFPYLKEVIVGECPLMKTFCHGVLRTPKLKGVQAKRGDKSHTHWKHDLNTTIHSLWEDKPV